MAACKARLGQTCAGDTIWLDGLSRGDTKAPLAGMRTWHAVTAFAEKPWVVWLWGNELKERLQRSI